MNFLDLFAGIGGFRLGMEAVGHTCVGYVENDKFARKSYEAIHNTKGEWTAHDITTISDREIEALRHKNIQCINAGFPCQSFSVAGRRRGFNDTRGTLFFEIGRLAKILKPRYLFLENVKGLLSHNSGETFRAILFTLDDIGYNASWQVLNSKNFGVPQHRERVFIIGRLRGRCTREVFPISGGNEKTLSQLVGGHQGQRVYDPCGLSCALAALGGGQGAKTGLYLINIDHNRLKMRKKGYSTCLDANYYKGLDNHQARTGVLKVRACLTPARGNKRQNGRRIKEPDEPMYTLTRQDIHGVVIDTKQAGKPKICKGYSPTLLATDCKEPKKTLENNRIRKLTPRECWRLQGFPDWALDKARAVGISDTQLYRQAGNAVTVNVVKAIAEKL